MANEKELVTVLEIQTGKTITTLNEAREAVRALRQEVAKTEITDEKYTETTKRLAAAQEALTQLTRQTTAAQAENWEGVDLATKSYNELTKQMKALNAEWRATTNATQRQQLGEQILAIRNRLKDMDESTGNFQRNVGNYTESVSKSLKDFTKAAGNAIPGLNKLNAAAEVFSHNPLLAILGLIAHVLSSVVGEMKKTETGTKSVNKAMSSLSAILEPVRDFFMEIVDGVGTFFSDLADDIDDTAQSTTILGEVMGGLLTILQPVFKFIRYTKVLFDGYAETMKRWRKEGKQAALEYSKAWKEATDAAWQAVKDSTNFSQTYDEQMERLEKRRQEREKRRQQEQRKEVEELRDIYVDLAAIFNRADEARQRLYDNLKKENPWNQVKKDIQEVQALIPELTEEERADMEEEDRYLQGLVDRAAKRKEIMAEFTKASASLLGDVADALEASEDTASRHAGTIKALRAAETVINTISGAMGAFMGITKDTGGWGIALAAVQAASIMATGYANVRKILATDTSKKASTSSVSTTSSVPAVSAPTVDYTPQTVTSATGAAEVERLNAGRGDQRVYVVYSDIAQAGRQVAVQQAESSFK